MEQNVVKPYKVKLVAVAKDEAVGLPRWIFHHLFFGIDSIDIYLNRTVDNSAELITNINKRYPNVNIHYLDWVDYVGDLACSACIQLLGYAQAYQQASLNRTSDYVMFLDIDEFWTPRNFKDSISDCVERLRKPETCIFEWMLLGKHEGREGEPVFKCNLSGRTSDRIKSMYKTGKFKLQIGCHHSIGEDACDAEGNKPMLRNWRILNHADMELKDYFVVHDLLGTVTEYVGRLIRGRVENNHNGDLTNNRHGYKISYAGFNVNFNIKQDVLDNYIQAYQEFYNFCDLARLHMHSCNVLRSRVNNFLKCVKEEGNDKIFNDVFDGVDLDELLKFGETIVFEPDDVKEMHYNNSLYDSYMYKGYISKCNYDMHGYVDNICAAMNCVDGKTREIRKYVYVNVLKPLLKKRNYKIDNIDRLITLMINDVPDDAKIYLKAAGLYWYNGEFLYALKMVGLSLITYAKNAKISKTIC